MKRLLLLAGAFVLVNPVASQTPPPRVTPPPPPARNGTPKLEAVAETRLLMEGLAQSNFRGAEKLLRQKPADVDDWTFIRGQALILAETANLLMLRPPRNPSQDAWMERAADMRSAATRLARAAADSDFERSRAAMTELGASCNRCHQAFRIPVKVAPFAEPGERKVSVER